MFNRIAPDLNSNLEEKASLVWLDAEVNTSEHNRAVSKLLQSLDKNLKKFDHIKQCQDALDTYQNKKIVLIVSGRLGREIVPQVHQLPQIFSIYVYCHDKEANEEWSSQFNKVREVIIDMDTLINEIRLSRRRHAEPEISLSYNIYTQTDNPLNSMMLNKKFTHLLIIIDALLRFEPKSNDKHELISYCKKLSTIDKRQLNMLNDFHDCYLPEKAVWWYTRESILYRTLNERLHTEPYFYELPVFHFFLNDIYQQLKNNQCQQTVQTYYGKTLLLNEIEFLKTDHEKYFSNVSFWLTDNNREEVIKNLIKSRTESDQQCVLFEIEAKPDGNLTKPFANISKLCHFDSRSKIMFMIGCIFRISNVVNDGGMWIVRLELFSEQDTNLKQLYQLIKEYQRKETIHLQDFANLLYRLKKYDGANKIYEQMLNQLPSDSPTCSDLHFARAAVAKDRCEYETSLKLFHKSLKIKQRTNPTDIINIGKIHVCIGSIHHQTDNQRDAIQSFQTAINLYKREHLENHPNMAIFYDNLAGVYKREKNYAKALEYYKQALEIDEFNSPTNTFGVAKSHNNLGCIYYRMKQYEDALKHFLYSLSVKLAIQPVEHVSIAKTYTNIASVYESLGNANEASNYTRKATTIQRQLSIRPDRNSRDCDDRLENIFLTLE